MKILFIGSLIDDKSIDTIVRNSNVKPSNAPVYFEKMLVKGMVENGADVSVLSVPTVSMYPRGSLFAWGRRKEKLDFGQIVTWIPCINLMLVKQLSIKICSFCEIIAWVIENLNVKDKVLLNYSVYPPYSSTTQMLGRMFHVKTCSIITDLPQYLYNMGRASGLRAALNKYYSKKMVKYQGEYDKYVFLTEHMVKRMHLQQKPSILMEGFADATIFSAVSDVPKHTKKTVMYAGRLSEDFNIRSLIDGFMLTKGDYELWLFGSGDMASYINDCSKQDSRITYFGKVDRNTLLKHMKMAHLLISVKSPNEDHANYAFPSKILEYMTSGTAVASTIVGGIPKEYFDYIIPIRDDSAQAVSACIIKAFAYTTDELIKKGKICHDYVVAQKNYRNQTKRILDLLKNKETVKK